jgi:hypothetical protein
MADVMAGSALALLIGLATGYVFERRATHAARAQAQELEEELEALRCSVLSMGGSSLPDRGDDHEIDLSEDVRKRARATQNAAGQVSKAQLVAHFVAEGHTRDEVVHAIEHLCDEGVARDAGRTVEMA